jgi:hypothetical protein
MAGEAKTSQFLLSAGTLMIGPYANLYSLNPAAHSIGLVKNVQVNSEQGLVELTQGVLNQIVYSVPNSVNVRVSAEVYEYTARNLAYAAGIDASGDSYNTDANSYTLDANIAANANLANINVTPFSNGDWVAIQNANDDVVHVTRVTVNSGNLDLERPVPVAFDAATARVFRVKELPVGLPPSSPSLAAKIVGILPENNEPVTILFPKIRITKGLALSFQTENFSNMPFEFTAYSLVSTDPLYAAIGANRMALAYKG